MKRVNAILSDNDFVRVKASRLTISNLILLGLQSHEDNPQLIRRVNDIEGKHESLYDDVRKHHSLLLELRDRIKNLEEKY